MIQFFHGNNYDGDYTNLKFQFIGPPPVKIFKMTFLDFTRLRQIG